VSAVGFAELLTRSGAAVDVAVDPHALEWVGPAAFRAATHRELWHPGTGDPDLLLWWGEAEADREADGAFQSFLLHMAAGRIPSLHCQPPAFPMGSSWERVWEEWRDRADRLLRTQGTEASPWSGLRVLVTAGPTREPLDRVRYLGNRSSGRMGFALARDAWLRGARVTLVTGPSALSDPVGVEVHRVETALQMREVVLTHAPEAALAIFAAAVSDFRPETSASVKRKRSETGAVWDVRLVENPDISRDARPLCPPGGIRVGFALETGSLEARAREKLDAKGFDLIVANDADDPGSGFDVPTNRVTLIGRQGSPERLPLLSKEAVARQILDRVTPLLEAAAP
jgi:phosphopantothenoylcysteine synthetase/decarboxylase